MDKKMKLKDYPVIYGDIINDICPVCEEEMLTFPDSYLIVKFCTVCNYHKITGLNEYLYDEDFLNYINIEKAPRYFGYIYYKQIPRKEEKKKLLINNLTKLYEEIEKAKVEYEIYAEKYKKILENASKWDMRRVLARMSLNDILAPIGIWGETELPETLEEALEKIDELVDSYFSIDKFYINKELNSKELKELLEIYHNENVDFSKSALKYHDRENGRIYYLVKPISSEQQDNVVVVKPCNKDVEFYFDNSTLRRIQDDLNEFNQEKAENSNEDNIEDSCEGFDDFDEIDDEIDLDDIPF